MNVERDPKSQHCGPQRTLAPRNTAPAQKPSVRRPSSSAASAWGQSPTLPTRRRDKCERHPDSHSSRPPRCRPHARRVRRRGRRRMAAAVAAGRRHDDEARAQPDRGAPLVRRARRTSASGSPRPPTAAGTSRSTRTRPSAPRPRPSSSSPTARRPRDRLRHPAGEPQRGLRRLQPADRLRQRRAPDEGRRGPGDHRRPVRLARGAATTSPSSAASPRARAASTPRTPR